jgi:hypothetical protein
MSRRRSYPSASLVVGRWGAREGTAPVSAKSSKPDTAIGSAPPPAPRNQVLLKMPCGRPASAEAKLATHGHKPTEYKRRPSSTSSYRRGSSTGNTLSWPSEALPRALRSASPDYEEPSRIPPTLLPFRDIPEMRDLAPRSARRPACLVIHRGRAHGPERCAASSAAVALSIPAVALVSGVVGFT